MYTRNYRQIREDSKQRAEDVNGTAAADTVAERRADGGSEDNFSGNDVGIVWEVNNEKEPPPGYRGTAMLRDPGEAAAKQMSERENEFWRESESQSESQSKSKTGSGKRESGGADNDENDGNDDDDDDDDDNDDDNNDNRYVSGMRRIPRQPLRRIRVIEERERERERERDSGGSRCDCSVKKRPDLFGHGFSSDDLLLGGLIILLLNEGSDDILIITLALLLISGFGGSKGEVCD